MGAIAQLVEQRTENPCVPGSIPGGTTNQTPKLLVLGFFSFIEMKYICYIIFSRELDKFYVGYTTISGEVRLEKHLKDYYGLTKYTHKAKDWYIFLEIECKNSWQARAIEKHIKCMKSKRYIKNLKIYPEMISTLLIKYTPPEN